jgi:predicted extracellular nuclease
MKNRILSVMLITVALIALSVIGVGTPRPVQASASGIVISQVYGGGGNTGATYKQDFVELFNAGTGPVTLTGWSLQYASSTGTSWTVASLTSATINAGKYYLVQVSQGAGGTVDIPADQTTATALNMSSSNGKIALVNSTTSCTGTDCAGATRVDFVGYGTANAFEGSGAAAALSNTTSAKRNNSGCQDTDNNSADFTVGEVHPFARNSSTPTNLCTGGGTATPTATVTAGPSPTPTVTATATSTVMPGSTKIRDIQGSAHRSPMVGMSVTNIQGIVTAVVSNGFYIQEPDASIDGNIATSEGILVYTNSTPPGSAVVGNLVSVNGTVTEYRQYSDSLTLTEITAPTVSVISTGNPLPLPIVIGAGGRVPPATVINDDGTGNIETSGTFDVATDGVDFYESLEGMRVQVNNPVAVSPTSNFNEIVVILDGGTGFGPRTSRGGIYVSPTDFNPERIYLDDAIIGSAMPQVNVGATFTGSSVGVMDYAFRNFRIQVAAAPVVASNPLAREVTALQGTATKLTIANFNVENLKPVSIDGATKYNSLAGYIVTNLKAPDIIITVEIQDNSGSTDNGIVSASQTWSDLITYITNNSGPTYSYRQIDPVNGQDGGQPGGNIRVGFLYNAGRVTFVDRGTCGATTNTTVTNSSGFPLLNCSPGRIDPTNSAWNSSRKPVVGEFTFLGQTVFVIGNHFNSKGGDNPLFGPAQPPVLTSETQRNQQAAVVNSFAQQILAVNPNANIVVGGDLNDFQFSTPLATLKGTQLTNLMDLLPANERYTYVFDGNSQVLDQILVSNAMYANTAPEYDVVHINSEFNDQISDHEPNVARFTFGGAPTATPTLTPVPTSPDTIGLYNNGLWQLRNTNSTGAADITVTFGGDPSDLPVVGDWNSDNVDTIGVYRNSTGVFLLSNSNTVPSVAYSLVFGNPGDTPFSGRWDNVVTNDGVGVYRNTNGVLYLKRNLTTGFDDYFFIFGNPGDQGVGGDWDGNGYGSIGIYRASNQTWYMNNDNVSGINYSEIDFVWNIGTSNPVTGDWNGDGITTVGYYTTGGVFVLHSTNATIGSDNTFAFGAGGTAKPVAGRWGSPTAPALSVITNGNLQPVIPASEGAE